MKASAIARANIALVKYWGKRNEQLNLPARSSIGLTLSGLDVHTTVAFMSGLPVDSVCINGVEAASTEAAVAKRISHFLERVRSYRKTNLQARVVSTSSFPATAGLASSAAGFAALAKAASTALGLELEQSELSRLARFGSGSAARSTAAGFVEWRAGIAADGSDCLASSIYPARHWPELRVLVCITERRAKKVSSRDGMAQCKASSPLYAAWLQRCQDDLPRMRNAIAERSFEELGHIAEQNAMYMHAANLTTHPPLIYLNGATLAVLKKVAQWRSEGLPAYSTVDAGPQVKVLCLNDAMPVLLSRLHSLPSVKDIIVCRLGEGVLLTENHLF